MVLGHPEAGNRTYGSASWRVSAAVRRLRSMPRDLCEICAGRFQFERDWRPPPPQLRDWMRYRGQRGQSSAREGDGTEREETEKSDDRGFIPVAWDMLEERGCTEQHRPSRLCHQERLG